MDEIGQIILVVLILLFTIFLAAYAIKLEIESMDRQFEREMRPIMKYRERLLTELHGDLEKLEKIEEEIWYLREIEDKNAV